MGAGIRPRDQRASLLCPLVTVRRAGSFGSTVRLNMFFDNLVVVDGILLLVGTIGADQRRQDNYERIQDGDCGP